jgi:hypothetical protein
VNADAGVVSGKTDKASSTIVQVSLGVKGIRAQIGSIVTALHELSRSKREERAQRLQAVSADIDKTNSYEATVAANAEILREMGKDYFKSWKEGVAAIQNPSLRQESEAQRILLNKSLNDVLGDMESSRKLFGPVIQDFKEVRQSLSGNLADENMRAVKKLISKAENESQRVSGTLDRLAASLDVLAANIGQEDFEAMALAGGNAGPQGSLPDKSAKGAAVERSLDAQQQ